MLDFINDIFYSIQQLVSLFFRLPVIPGVSIGTFMLFMKIIDIIANALWG